MKKIYYIIFIVLSLFAFSIKTKAVCNLEEEKLKASKIEVSYDINLEAYKQTGKYNQYSIKFYNISNSIKVYDAKLDRTFAYFAKDNYVNDRSYADDYTVGTHYFSVYSSYCTEAISTITIKIPKFNEYSVDPLCEGITEEELAVCGKWYDNRNISYNDFVKTVNNYKKSNGINDNTDDDNNNVENDNNTLLNTINEFVRNNYLYVAGGAVIILILIIVLIAIRRKRGRLE